MLGFDAIAQTAIAALPGAPSNSAPNWQTLNPDAFRKPFPVTDQQFFAAFFQGETPTAKTPHGWDGHQLNYQFAVPIKASIQQFAAQIPRIIPTTANVFGVQYQSPDIFAKPFPAASQRFADFEPQGFIKTTFPDGWRGLQLEYRFAKPFPTPSQQFLALPTRHVPEPSDVEGWFPIEWDYRYLKPFPVNDQVFTSFEPRGFTPSLFHDGWRGIQLDYRFKQLFPSDDQQFATFFKQPASISPQGWFLYAPEKFAKPYPVIDQKFGPETPPLMFGKPYSRVFIYW